MTENLYKLLTDGVWRQNPLPALLAQVRFSDPAAAGRCLQRLEVDTQLQPAFLDLYPHLLAMLSSAASPDRVLISFERFLQSATNAPELLRTLAHSPRTIAILGTLFDGSQFLTEILLSHPGYFDLLAEHQRLAQPKSVRQYFAAAQSFAAPSLSFPVRLDALRQYQRRELLRIGACDLLDFYDLPTVTEQLSNLACGLVQAALQSTAGSYQLAWEGFSAIAVGKLGGQELNYSSDIDLLFIGSEDLVEHQRLGEKLVQALAQVTEEGFLYRVDMRLRPWGQVGALVPSLASYLAYLKQHARIWEKQALLKASCIAGDEALGNEFLNQARAIIFDSIPETLRADVFAMKQRTEEHLRRQGRQWGEVKLGAGSIRDIEFIAQFLQLSYGKKLPVILTPNTLKALAELHNAGLLSANEYRVLADGYIVLRTIEHFLQMMHYQQTNQLPTTAEALSQLARRLGFRGPEAGDHFVLRYEQHCSAIRAIYTRQIGNDEHAGLEENSLPNSMPDIPHHLLRMDPSYALTFSPQEVAQHAYLAERLAEDHLVEVVTIPLEEGRWRITIVAFDYPGELSLICGLLFVHNLNILDGNVFTYERFIGSPREARRPDLRPKIVDAFTVQPVNGEFQAASWLQYKADLAALLKLMHQGQRREARAELAKRVALTLPEPGGAAASLYPIDIEIDNSASSQYTLLRIEALDTPGFLYELANALAFHRIYIARVMIGAAGSRVQDVLWVTNAAGQKIIAPEEQHALRAAVVLIKHFTHLLPHSPNPESALLHFRELIEQLFTHPNWPDELASLEQPEVLGALARLLGVSDFLWDDFLRMQHASLFPVVRDVGALASPKSHQQLRTDLAAAVAGDRSGWRSGLNTCKDRELFRVDMRHILGYTREFEGFSQELTDLVEVVVETAYQRCFVELIQEFGAPALENGRPCPAVVCGLGKCGGRELGFASDIELMFLYGGNGLTQSQNRITTAEFFEKLVENFLSALQARQEGIFQIDLQLRPYGKAGGLAVSQEAFRRYYAPDGAAWAYERQALVKLRPLGGDQELGDQIVRDRDAFVYSGRPFDVTAMRAMRERQIRHLVSGGTFNAKFSPGGLLDVEYLVQGLQITYGQHNPALRSTNTRQALAALAEQALISQEVYVRLRKAYTFLRWLIDSLRVVRGNAKDLTVPPPESDEFAFLARRLRYGKDLVRLSEDLARFAGAVHEINARLLN